MILYKADYPITFSLKNMLWDSFQLNVENKYASNFVHTAEYSMAWITTIYITYPILMHI